MGRTKHKLKSVACFPRDDFPDGLQGLEDLGVFDVAFGKDVADDVVEATVDAGVVKARLQSSEKLAQAWKTEYLDRFVAAVAKFVKARNQRQRDDRKRRTAQPGVHGDGPQPAANRDNVAAGPPPPPQQQHDGDGEQAQAEEQGVASPPGDAVNDTTEPALGPLSEPGREVADGAGTAGADPGGGASPGGASGGGGAVGTRPADGHVTGLKRKLQALGQEMGRLRSENEALRHEMGRLRSENERHGHAIDLLINAVKDLVDTQLMPVVSV